MEDAQQMLVNLGIQRQLSGHYTGGLIAIDPHRIVSTSKRIMAKKRKVPSRPSQKMIKTFFSVDAQSGQPIMFTMSSSGMHHMGIQTVAQPHRAHCQGQVLVSGRQLTFYPRVTLLCKIVPLF